MSVVDGIVRQYDDGPIYSICIENVPGRKRPVLTAQIGNEHSAVRLKVADVTDEDALREVMQGLFGGEWK